jgi:hypothetical protein
MAPPLFDNGTLDTAVLTVPDGCHGASWASWSNTRLTAAAARRFCLADTWKSRERLIISALLREKKKATGRLFSRGTGG